MKYFFYKEYCIMEQYIEDYFIGFMLLVMQDLIIYVFELPISYS